MSAHSSPWPAALTSAGIGVVVAVVLSFGLGAVTSPADAGPSPAAAGAAGADGADGRAGADGLDGADGAPGPVGATGATGATGTTGATGPAGADGLPGLDAAVAFAEAPTIVGTYTYTSSNGLHMSSALFPIAANIAPGQYVLVFDVPRITHDIGISNQPIQVDCRLTGPATVADPSTFIFLPASGLRSYSPGEGPTTRGTIWNTSAIRAVTVTGAGPIGVECWSAHSNPNLPAPDPSVELHQPSALLLRAP